MNIFNRANQGGVTVLGFIIVGVVLALVTVGAVYGLYQRGDRARRDQAIAVVEDQQQAAGDQAPAPEDATDDQPAVTPAPTQPVVEPTPAPAELPATGPADTAMIMLVLAVLTASIAAYVGSRRYVRVTL
jgi:LPXTG-motif cell wall-anchored protein